jgi:hypothetical protein
VALHEKYGASGLVVVGLNIWEQGDNGRKFAAENLPYRVLFQMDDAARGKDFVRGIPTTYILDREGVVRHRVVGSGMEKRLEEYVAALLAPGS